MEHNARPSLLAAVDELRRAAVALDDEPGAIDSLGLALRHAMVAVENELGSGGSRGGSLGSLGTAEPRLIPALERIEVDLAGMLVLLWQGRTSAGPINGPAIAEVVRRMESTANQVLGVLHESMRAVGTSG